MADPFSAAVDEVFKSPIGIAATYTAPERPTPTLDVRVIVSAPDEIVGGFRQDRTVETTEVRVRASEVPIVKIGGEFRFGGKVHRVGAAPVRDLRRLVWICEAPEVGNG